jgi:hypothetical protein
MPAKEEIKTILDSILKSKEFKFSPVYQKLLTYLVEAYLCNQIPKEVTVAIEVFGKDTSYNSNKDSSVRYHVHVLRKKLAYYYKNEGKADATRLVIPVGHYEIQFANAEKESHSSSNKFFSFLKQWAMVIILLLLVLNLFFIFLLIKPSHILSRGEREKIIAVNDPIWGSFFDNQFPISIILGDDFLLDEYNPELKRYRQIRDWKIDSENDLYNFLIQYPKTNIWKSEITGIPFGGFFNLMDILPIAYQFQGNIALKMSSAISLEEIRDHNVIYIGEFKNLRVLNKILFKTPIRYQYHPDERLFIINEKGDTLNTFVRIEAPYEQLNKYNVDYSLLIKMPGFTHENLMFIVGFGYGGRLERTKMLADPMLRKKFIADIDKLNKSIPDYFIALFEVKSIERTGFTNELKYFQKLSGDFFQGGE